MQKKLDEASIRKSKDDLPVRNKSSTPKAYAATLTSAALIDDEPMVDPETGELIEPLK